jgi:glycosidase
MREKIFIYQLIPRLFGNKSKANIKNGSIEDNGSGKFNDITFDLLDKLKKSGYTHIWYIGIIAHASATDYTSYGIPQEYPEIVKGKAGSPYAIRDYYDVDPDLAEDISKRMTEFENLIARTHKLGLKVIIDNVPNHVARNYKSVNKPDFLKDFGEDDDNSKSFNPQNNFYYLPNQELDIQLSIEKKEKFHYFEFPAKATGNDCFTNKPTQYDWYETVKLNYGVDYQNDNTSYFNSIPDTWKKMKDILLFWADKLVDGFRCDMAEMVPLEFWKWCIPQIKAKYPKIIFIAEIYNPSQYRNFLNKNCFDYLYDKVGLYDVLRDVSCGYRPSSDISFTLNNVGDIQDKMLNFMENHDEQRMASDYFLKDGLKGKAAMILTCCVNKNPVMIYSGQEFGERGMDEEGYSGKNGRTTIFDYWSVDTLRRWNNDGKWNNELLKSDEINLSLFYTKLITLCNKEKSVSQGLFYDLMQANYENPDFDSTRLFAFLRSYADDILLIIINFDRMDKECTLYIPEHVYSYLEKEIIRSGKLTPLLENNDEEIIFFDNQLIRIKIGANSGNIYRLIFD